MVRAADLSEPNGRTLLTKESLTSLAMLAGWATPTTMASAFSLSQQVFLYIPSFAPWSLCESLLLFFLDGHSSGSILLAPYPLLSNPELADSPDPIGRGVLTEPFFPKPERVIPSISPLYPYPPAVQLLADERGRSSLPAKGTPNSCGSIPARAISPPSKSRPTTTIFTEHGRANCPQ